VWAWGVAESGVIARWYCLIAHWFAISGGRMMALHSDICGGRKAFIGVGCEYGM
jgi:hypothetical protein